jgi:ATP-binding cassette, subfamily B, bacterial
MGSLKDLKHVIKYMKWLKEYVKPLMGWLILIILLDSGSSIAGVSISIVSKNIIDSATSGKLDRVFLIGVLYVLIVLINMGMGLLSSFYSVRVTEEMSNKIRQGFYSKFMKAEWSELSEFHSGDLVTRMTSDVSSITSVVVGTVPAIISLGVQLLAAFLVLVRYDARLGILAFVIGPSVVLLSRLWGRKLKQLQLKTQESESAFRAFIQETIQNLLIIKCFVREDSSRETLQSLHENRMVWIKRRNLYSMTANATLRLGYWFGYLLAFGWGAYGIYKKTISFGTMTAFLQLVGQVQGPFMGLARTIPQIITSMASIDRLLELEKLDNEISTGELPNCDSVGVTIKNVSFSYKDGQKIIDNISFNVCSGEIVALVGPSGEGKTTIIRLILALLKPSEGRIYLTSKYGETWEVASKVRSIISYVPQGNTLFSGTIADNLRFGKFDATFEEMRSAAQDACVWEFIDKLPDKFDTVIGERGLGLSEGQAQRIAIARAFLKKAPILILDEATSALDVNSELHVLKSVKKHMENCTCIVITHRPSALEICTRILRIENGKLTEQAHKKLGNSILDPRE